MVIGNATGCSSIWGGSAPSIPYCVNKDGHGPTWGNSLFEDPAEFTYGMLLGAAAAAQQAGRPGTEALASDIDDDVKEALRAGWTT
jgi:pyruvate-ferredoxin/flavodoxin oxidoreductase